MIKEQMLNLLFTDTASSLRTFLQSALPSLADDWWERHVVAALSFQQQRLVEEKKIGDLFGLDLAALLRVLDQNWSELSHKASLPREARNYIKDMQTIRNRWAHSSDDNVSQDDAWRELDTLQRLLESIKADGSLVDRVRDLKKSCHFTPSPAIHKDQSPPPPSSPKTEFQKGDEVVLRSDHSVAGVVTEVLPGGTENRYTVFTNSGKVTYYASQLVLHEPSTQGREVLSPDKFHACLTALQLKNPGIANLYSLHAARVNFIPYQFKPVMKLVRSDRPRLLVADGVGVGKTIEAGLILRELQARRDINSVLIICPKPLVTERKWQAEMKRFDEHFEHLDGKTLRHCIDETDKDGAWPEKHSKVILPFSLFNEELFSGSDAKGKRRNKCLGDLDPPPHFDLVIVDEAHHLRNTSTSVHKGVRYFCDNAEAVVFLTATPIQLGSDDLFVLLNMLRPDIVIDQASFAHMAEPNPHVNKAIDLARAASQGWREEAQAAFRRALDTRWGQTIFQKNPEFKRLFDLLHDHEPTPAERVAFIRDAEQLHTFSSIINRTRRRDIGNFTTRKPETVTVDFTPGQRELHDRILAIQARILQHIHGDVNLKFMMTTIRRQAASCLFGLAPFLRDILNRRVDELQFDEADDLPEAFDLQGGASIKGEIEEILALLKGLDPADPKLDALLKVVADKQKMPNNKILLFSSFRHTLNYILEHLLAKGVRVGLIHGGTPDEERRDLRDRFSLPKESAQALDVLLSSEVGCEGLDYQFCDCMVNYDLPWNPMRVEQRIGRIDRYGQQSDTVVIYNLVTPGTVDADIYERCLLRIGVFNSALGGSEEILGDIADEIREVANNLTLTEEERAARLQQLADNDIRLIQEQEALEESQVEFFGLRLPRQQTEEDVNRCASNWLSADALQNLVRRYLEETCGNGEYILGEKPLKTLRLSQEARNRLLEDFGRLKLKPSPLRREWEKWLKGAEPHRSITFDADCAAGNRDAAFITPVHPLAMQAAHALGNEKAVYTALKVTTAAVAPGHYPFAVYRWHKQGIREDVVFQPVCADPALSEQFFTLLEQAVQPDAANLPDRSVFDSLDAEHHRLWSDARTEHKAHNTLLAQYRAESLRTSHNARLAILREQLDRATEEKIRRMKQAETGRAEADFERRMAEIEKAGAQADITAHAVAFGVMVVEVGH